jgi:hypothetical protein
VKKVFKYPLPQVLTELVMPVGAELLCVDMQAGSPTLWALVEPDAKTVRRRFEIVGTGHPVADNLSYVGTAFNRGPEPPYFPNGFVWHVFEAPRV